MTLYAGIDLHSSNHDIAIMDQEGRRLFHKKISNDPVLTLEVLGERACRGCEVAVESTYNWYWLVDALAQHGYRVHLANPGAMTKYSGLMHSDDKSDAFWLAEMLRLGILPEGHICPRGDRLVRDMLRKRSHLVRLRTSLILSLQNALARSCGLRVSASEIKRSYENSVAVLLKDQAELALTCGVGKAVIDSLTANIGVLERSVEKKVKDVAQYCYLRTMPGGGPILSQTILLESGDMRRFPKVGNYASYCRKVASAWSSNGKLKGRGNRKNGNKYLAWAFSEAAEMARRFDRDFQAYFQRKAAKSNAWVARRALECKMTRATYYILRDGVPFDKDKLFA